MVPRLARSWWIRGIVALGLLVLVVSFIYGNIDRRKTMEFGDVIAEAKAGQIQSIEVRGNVLTIHRRDDPESYRSNVTTGTDVTAALQNVGVDLGGSGANAVRLKYDNLHPPWAGPVNLLVILTIISAFAYVVLRLALRPYRTASHQD
jgi:hypothetical protein